MFGLFRKIEGKWIFFSLVVLLAFFSAILDYSSFRRAVILFASTLYAILPSLIAVFAIMLITNLFVKPKFITKYLGKESGSRGWLIAIGGGIISAGPIYLWYPLLSDLKEKGVSRSLIATFLYSRAVKIPLMPLMALYFGWFFVIVFSIYLIIFSVLNGWLVGKFTGEEVNSK